MAEAIWKGLRHARMVNPSQGWFTELNPDRCKLATDNYHIHCCDLDTLYKKSEIIIFCVKPQIIPDLLKSFPRTHLSLKFLISIAAGIPISKFEKELGGSIQLLRVMPNTPAVVGEALCALTFNTNVTPTFKQIGKNIFSGLGRTEIVPEEWIDGFTGLSGSGPAFFYKMAEALIEVAQEEGIPPEISLPAIAQTLIGSGKMLLTSNKQPSELITEVASPKGTTVAGLEQLEKTDLLDALKQIVRAAILRSKELSQS